MKKETNASAEKFTKALSSALSVSREEMQKRLREAKPEKPSPHKRYSYDPEADRS
jgi:hypothetical protein